MYKKLHPGFSFPEKLNELLSCASHPVGYTSRFTKPERWNHPPKGSQAAKQNCTRSPPLQEPAPWRARPSTAGTALLASHTTRYVGLPTSPYLQPPGLTGRRQHGQTDLDHPKHKSTRALSAGANNISEKQKPVAAS